MHASTELNSLRWKFSWVSSQQIKVKKIGSTDLTLVNNFDFYTLLGMVKKRILHCGIWSTGFSEDFPKKMEIRKMAVKLTFSYQYIINHRRTMQIFLAHIEWICCIQEYFLRGSISHHKWISFLLNFLPSLMNFINVSLPLANRHLSALKCRWSHLRLWYSHSGFWGYNQ